LRSNTSVYKNTSYTARFVVQNNFDLLVNSLGLQIRHVIVLNVIWFSLFTN